MKKNLIISLIVILVIALCSTGYWWFFVPHNAVQQYSSAERFYIKTELQAAKPNIQNSSILWLKSIKKYEKVLDRFPLSEQAPMALFKQGIIYEEKLNQPEQALAIYRKLVSIYPESSSATEALYRKAMILTDVNKKGQDKLEAIDDLRRLVNKSPTSPLASKSQYRIGAIYEDIKEYGSAVNEYQKVVDNYPTSEEAPKAQLRIAQIAQEKTGQTQEAKTAYDKLLKKYASSKEARVASAMKGKLASEEKSKETEGSMEKYYGSQPVEPIQHERRREELLLDEKVRTIPTDILAYRLHLKLFPPEKRLEGTCELDLVNLGPATSELRFKFNPELKLSKVLVNGKSAQYTQDESLLKVNSTNPIKQGEKCVVSFEYAGKQTDIGKWVGDPIRPEGTYLRFESKWYPQGAWGDTALSDIIIEAPSKYTVVAVGGMTETKNLPGAILTHWKSGVPLFGFALTAFEFVRNETLLGNIPIQVYLSKSHAKKANTYLQEITKIIQFYSSRFGTFPYAKLAVAEVPWFPGGYGSPSLVMLTDKAIAKNEVPVSLLAHEIAHQWWGNLVTIKIRENSIPWLSEGFATYSDCLYMEYSQGKPAMQKHLLELGEAYREASGSKEEESILSAKWDSNMYQRTVYYKGAYVLHALRYLVGDTKFFQILQTFSKKYAGQVVNTRDFQSVCEQVYGQNLDWFFEQWLGRTGLPEFRLANHQITKDAKGYKLEAQIVQSVSVYKTPLEVTLNTGKGSITNRILVDKMVTPLQFVTPEKPVSLELDKENWILQSIPAGNEKRKLIVK